MTTDADQVLPGRVGGPGRLAARACIAAGVTGAFANTLLVAYAVLAFVRPGAVQAALWPLACTLAGTSSALLVPVALVLGGSTITALGVAATGFAALAWLLLATGVLTAPVGASLLAGAGLGLSAWLVQVCRRHTVPPRAGRVGRRAGAAAFAGTLVVTVGRSLLPPDSIAWLVVLVIGGLPAVVGWFCVPAWSLRLGRWLRVAYDD